MSESLRFRGWPRCGASAAIFRGEEVLLIQRAKGTFTGQWSFPGGHVEPGEPARQAAGREVLEETGVVADIGGLIDVHDVIARGDDGALLVHYVISVYWGRWRSGEAMALTDARAARFWPLAAIGEVPVMAGTVDLVRRAAVLASIGKP